MDKVKLIAASDYLKLIFIFALAFYLVFIPHQSYPYPVHLDEWIHMACSQEIIREGAVFGLTDPFSGGGPNFNQLFEFGFHVFWAVFYMISGISWFDIFKYFPSMIFIITVLSVYVLAHRQGFGWEAAVIACLIPTTIGLLGPGFLVPVAMGLLFISLSLFVAFNIKGWLCYTLLFIFSLFLFSIHAVTAVGLIIILLPYLLLSLKKDPKHSLGIALSVFTPFALIMVLFPEIWDRLVLHQVESLMVTAYISPFIDVPHIITMFGYIPILLGLLGIFIMLKRGGGRNHGLILGLLVLLIVLYVFFTFGYGANLLYYRGLIYLMLLLSIAAGAGLMSVKNYKLPTSFVHKLKVAHLGRSVGYILCPLLIILILYTAIPVRQNILYYHMIDEQDFQAFVWIRDNLDSSYQKAILDPWKGAAFTAVTGKNVYTMIQLRALPTDKKAYNFLSDGCKGTSFLKNNVISVVYTRDECDNPELVEVRDGIYLFEEARILE